MELSIHNTQTIQLETKRGESGVQWVEIKITDDQGHEIEIAAFGKPLLILGVNDA